MNIFVAERLPKAPAPLPLHLVHGSATPHGPGQEQLWRGCGDTRLIGSSCLTAGSGPSNHKTFTLSAPA